MPDTEPNLLDDLAEEFACRWRAGERPSVEEYVQRCPEHADEVRAILDAVVMMEQLKPRRTDEPTVTTPQRPPERIGDYRIIREIGRGGMGVVYEAEQESLGRRVAIKLLPGHLLANERLRERFHREAQAAARLHHTNIVPVYGVGEHQGQCFYVMQLIDGRGLDQIIRQTAAARGRPSGELSSPETDVEPTALQVGATDRTWPDGRPVVEAGLADPSSWEFFELAARIGAQVADALSYAHQQGVLHRDVKPSNLLLDDRGAVWMTDFGVAKTVEEANLTQSGDLVGTLKYMPPERFSGQSDGRGDVYSLGVTLYELLTLRPAFPETTPQHLIQLISHQAPPGPRKLNPDLPQDLETIVLKAMSRDPEQRYQSPAEMGEDLRRFLDDRPIVARRASVAEQLWRWCRRNRMVASLAAAVFTLLAVTAAVSAVAYFRTAAAVREADEANERMKAALEAEQKQREHAEKTSASALDAMNQIYDRFAPSRIVVTPALPAGSDAEEGIHLPSQPFLSPEAVPLLEALLGFYEQLAREGSDSAKLRAQAAEANQRIGDIRQRLGRIESAIAAYRKAGELYSLLTRDTLDETLRIHAARTHNELGRALRAMQQLDEARDAHARALETLTAAPQDQAARPEHRFELARTYYFQSQREPPAKPRGPDGPGPGGPRGPGGPGGPGGRRGPPDEGRRGGPPGGPGDFGRPPPRGGPPGGPGADHPVNRAIALLEVLVKEYPAVPEYRHLLACCYRDAPPMRRPDGPPSVSASTHPSVLLLRQLVKDFPRSPDYRYDLCETLGRLGFTGRLSPESAGPARELLVEAVGLASALAAEYPNVPQYVASEAVAREKLGLVLHWLKQSDAAEKELFRAVSLQGKLARQFPEVMAHHFSLALTESSLAGLLEDVGKWKEARALLDTSTDRLNALLKKDQRLAFVRTHLAQGYRDLSRVLGRLGETEPAAEAQRKAEALAPERGPNHFGPHEPRRDRK